MVWVPVVFGWPAAFAALLAGTFGLILKQWRLVLLGALIGSPFLFYLSLTPRFGWIAILVAVCYGGAVAAMYRHRLWLAWLLFAPMCLLVVYVGSVVAVQAR